jgi:hypothetical protein
MPKEYSAEPCPRCLKERTDGTLGENYRCEACRILFFEWKLSEKDKTINHLDIELKKKERKIKSFCKNDCDGGKEMGLCECCSLGTLLDSSKSPSDEHFKIRTERYGDERGYGIRIWVNEKKIIDQWDPKKTEVMSDTEYNERIQYINSICGIGREREDMISELNKERIHRNNASDNLKDPIDPNYPKCAGCRRASHNAHCGLAVTGKCKDGSLFELGIKCPKCDMKLIGKYDEDGKLIGRFCENCSYTEGDA